MLLNRLSINTPLLVNVFLVWTLSLGVSLSANETAVKTDPLVRAELLEQLANADSPETGRQAEDAMWNFWFDHAPTPAARQLLDAGIKRREAYDYESAEKLFNELVILAPNYSEGYNQRAFIRFLRGNHAEAQADLEKALTLEPKHFGALAGLYQIHMILNRPKAGFEFLRQAVQIHPWLRERSALPKNMLPDSVRSLQQRGIKI